MSHTCVFCGPDYIDVSWLVSFRSLVYLVDLEVGGPHDEVGAVTRVSDVAENVLEAFRGYALLPLDLALAMIVFFRGCV